MKLHLNLALRRAVLAAMAMVALGTAQAEDYATPNGVKIDTSSDNLHAYLTGNGSLTLDQWKQISGKTTISVRDATEPGVYLEYGKTYTTSANIFVGGKGYNSPDATGTSAILDVGSATLKAGSLYIGASTASPITGTMTVNGGTVNAGSELTVGAYQGNGVVTAEEKSTIIVTTDSDGGVFRMGYHNGGGQEGDNTFTLDNSILTVGAAGGAVDKTSIGMEGGNSTLYLQAGAEATLHDQVIVGERGIGKISVEESTLTMTGTTVLGLNKGAKGTITGVAATMNADKLIVGASGTGEVTLEPGSTLSAGSITVGDQAGSNGTLNIVGAVTTGQLTIGNAGTGTFTIMGTLGADTIVLGNQAGSKGTLEILHSEEVKPIESLYVGYQGTGELSSDTAITATNMYVTGTASEASLAGLSATNLAVVGGTVAATDLTAANLTLAEGGTMIIENSGSISKADIYSGSTLAITGGEVTTGAVTNGGSITNAGTWKATGSTTNTGTIDNTGSLQVQGSMSNLGVLNGSGAVAVTQGSTLNLGGNTNVMASLSNAGTVNVTAGLSARDITNNSTIAVQGLGRIDATTLTGTGITTILVDKSTASTSAAGAIIDLTNASSSEIAVTIDLSNAAALVGKNVDFLTVGGTLTAMEYGKIGITGDADAEVKWEEDYIRLSESTRVNETTYADGSIHTTTTTVTEKLGFVESAGSTDAGTTGMSFKRHEMGETTDVKIDWAGIASVELEVKTETVVAVEEKVETEKLEAVEIKPADDATEEQKQQIAATNQANAAAAELVAQADKVQSVEISSGVEAGSGAATTEKKAQVIVGKDTATEGSGSMQVQSVVVNQITKFNDPDVDDKKETVATSGLTLVFEGENKVEGSGEKDKDGKNKSQLGFSKDTQEGIVKLDKTKDETTEVQKVDIVQVKGEAKVEIKNVDMHATHALTIGNAASTQKTTLVLDNVNFHVGGETDVNVLHMVEVKKYNADGSEMLDANGNVVTEMKPVETEAHLTTKTTITNAEVQLLGSTVLKFEQIDFGTTDEKLAQSGMNREQIEKLHGDTIIKGSDIILTGGDAQLGENDYVDEHGKKHEFQQITLEDTHVRGSGKIRNARIEGKGAKLTVGSSPGVMEASKLTVNAPTEFFFITSSPEWDNHSGGAGLTTNSRTGAISQLYVDKEVTLNGQVSFLYETWNPATGKYEPCADTEAARAYIGSKITEDTVITFVIGNVDELTLGENFTVNEDTLPILPDGMEWDFLSLFTNGTITVIGEMLEEPCRVANSLVSAGETVLNFGRLSESQAILRQAGTTRTWGSAIADFSSVDGETGRIGYDYNTWGGAVGVDHAFTSRTVAGIAFGCTWGENEAETGNDYYNGGSIDQDGKMLGLYGVHKFRTKGLMNDVKLSAFAAYGWFENDSSRTGVKNGHCASAEWDSEAWVLSASLSRDITTDCGLVVTPYVGVEYTKAGMDDFTEKGKSYDARYTADEDYSNLAVKVGVSVSKAIGSFTPYAGIAYINDVARDTPEVTATGKRTITGKASMPGHSAVQLNVGTGVKLSDSWDAYAGYSAELRDQATEHNVNVGVGYTF